MLTNYASIKVTSKVRLSAVALSIMGINYGNSLCVCYLSILLSFIRCISYHESEFIRSKIAFACL